MGEFTDPHRNLHEDDDDEEEEALSLCNLPLDDEDETTSEMGRNHSRRSSSEPPELFEFFSNFGSEMCSAEDIIFCGKLIPFKEIAPPIHLSHQQDRRHISFRRRSESLSGLQTSSVSRSNSIRNSKSMMRNSRSLDYRKLERFSTSKTSPEFDHSFAERNSSVRGIGRGTNDSNGNFAKRAVTKPRWYVLTFGVVKPPIEMELRDIKSRQVRRNSAFPPPVVEKPPVGKGGGGTTCRLLKVLSCRDHTSVAVTTSLCVPPA